MQVLSHRDSPGTFLVSSAKQGETHTETALPPAAEVLAALAAPEEGTLHLARVGGLPIHAAEQAREGRSEALFLALATHGRSALEGWAAGGNVAVGVLEHSALPLLMVRVTQVQDGERPTA